MKWYEILIGVLISVILIVGSWFKFLPLEMTEVAGFITGGACVWLTVKQHIWNFPLGIANNVFFIVLFMNVSLFADAGLQLVYIVLGFLGWYWWLQGGENKSELLVSRATPLTLAIIGALVAVSTIGLMLVLQAINGAAPFWDALTTTLSLAAQFLLTRKLIENWYVWITADVIYIALYAYKGLYLTAILYFIFLCMCLAGLWNWYHSMQERKTALPITKEEVTINV